LNSNNAEVEDDIVPKQCHPVANQIFNAELRQFLNGIRNSIEAFVAKLSRLRCGSGRPAVAS
jgi:hypothetical protein